MLTGTAQFSRTTIALATFVLIATTIAAQDSRSPTAASGAGDPRNGLAMVQSSKCLDCHRIGEAGSRLGPDLTDIGSRRTVDRLRRALIAPDEEVLPENRFVRVVTPDGTTVTGKLLNQDAFSIQMMTPREELKTYLKARVRESAIVHNGLMPSYAEVLKESDIADVVSYLRTLTGAQSAVGVSRTGDDTGAAGKATGAFDRILSAEKEPQNWLTYSGGYASQRYSLLHEITRDNVKDLTLKWVWRPRYLDKMESTPLVVDGVLYTVQNSEVVALDAATGRSYWTFRYRVPPESNAYVMVVKGLAFAGDRLLWATYDGHLIAIDARNGSEMWNRTILDWKQGLQLNVAPLVVKDTVILGPATNEFGTNCWIAAFDVRTGSEVWRFKTVPEPGERGNDTWPADSWRHGGAPIWVTGSYDPATNLTFWGTGNPNPGWNGGPRNPGDNLYGDSVVALDADTGALKWYYQFTPNDEFDWDSVQVPVLADMDWKGRPRKVMLWANRNGFAYVLDRTTGEFLLGTAFVKQNWNLGFDNGRPVRDPKAKPTPEGTRIEPGTQGGTNWYSPSFSPRTGLFYVSAWDNYSAVARYADVAPWEEGKKYTGRAPAGPGGGAAGRAPVGYRTEEEGYGAVRAIDPKTGDKKWDFKMVDYTESGVLTTASDLLFSGGREGHFFALDARTGELLWTTNLGGTVANGPITFAADGRQYVAVAAEGALYVFGLRD
jgi:alcohol dehydrogenase (cytochrome c)